MKHVLFLAIGTLFLQPSWGASPWLPQAGKATATFMYVDDQFEDYWMGDIKARQPVPYGQQTYYGFFEYGLSPKLALDIETGKTDTAVDGNSLGGITDSVFGLRYQAYSRENFVLTLRGAAIVKGNYTITPTGRWSPGDKASGGLGSVMMGWSLPKRFFSFVETGYRVRQDPVPQDFFGAVGTGSSIKRLTWTTSYQTSRSINGIDIGRPPFTPRLFPATKKIFGSIDAAVYYRLRDDLNFGFNYGRVLHGRNVGQKRVYAVSVSYTLPWTLPHF